MSIMWLTESVGPSYDERNIFEDDEEEDEAYMFPGQGICIKYQQTFSSSSRLSNLVRYVVDRKRWTKQSKCINYTWWTIIW
jgi:hypothetical protein